MAVWRQGLAELHPSGSRSRPLSLASSSTPQRHAEFRCHSAILAARSPFFRSLLTRRMDSPIHLDEGIIPRIYAPVLLQALYTDQVDLTKVIRNCPIPINSLSEVQVIASGKCQVQPIDEATEIYHIAQFLEFPALAHGCETTIVEHVSAECVVGVYNWATEAHGSAFVRRHCVHFLAREFARVANTPLLFDLEEPLLYETLSSDFVQASELEILNAVIKWGEQTLMRRLEEREPNLIATTTHSISRKGLRRSELSDEELKEILANLMPLVRTDYILPPFHQALVSATSRGLVSCPPADLPGTSPTSRSGSESGTIKRATLGRCKPSMTSRSLSTPGGRLGSLRKFSSLSSDAVIEGGLGNPDGHWLHPHAAAATLPYRRTPRPRFFVPYFREATHQLHKRLQENPESQLLSHEPPPVASLAEQSQHLPDALYMIKPSTSNFHSHGNSAATYALQEERLGSGSDDSLDHVDIWLSHHPDEQPLPHLHTVEAAEERVAAYLRTSSTVQKGLACGCSYHRRAILRQVRLRALRELGCPDTALRILRRPERFYAQRRSSSIPSPPLSLPSSHYGDEVDPLGPLDLGYSAQSLDEDDVGSSGAWPDLMSSASLGREGRGVGSELREACEYVSWWSAQASAQLSDHDQSGEPKPNQSDSS